MESNIVNIVIKDTTVTLEETGISVHIPKAWLGLPLAGLLSKIHAKMKLPKNTYLTCTVYVKGNWDSEASYLIK